MLGVVTGVAAVAALVLDLGLGWFVAVPDGAVPTSEPLIADASGVGEGKAGTLSATSQRLSESAYREAILGRNIFDQSKIGVVEEAGAGGGDGVTQTELNVTLKGTVVAEPAEYSAAFIVEAGKESAYAYGIGQSVQGAEILEIQVDRVKFLRNGREEWLLMGEEKAGSTASAAAPMPEGDGDVQQSSETEFVVSRAMMDEKLNDLAGLAREARALLHRGPDGEYDGYRLSAIRRGSLADKLGIRNGDIVHSVNGLELNSLDGAMRALEALRSESGLKAEVTRRGQPVTLGYDIR